jgi:hypothetical protein
MSKNTIFFSTPKGSLLTDWLVFFGRVSNSATKGSTSNPGTDFKDTGDSTNFANAE